MMHVVAVVFAFFASISGATPLVPAPPPLEHIDECPNPAIENMLWLQVEGRVVEVTSVRTFRLRTDAGKVMDVSLANVGEPADAGGVSVLRRLIDGKRVFVMQKPSLDDPKSFAAEVHNEKERDLSLQLLRAGAASFVKEPAYTLSTYSECLHRIAAREAKAEGVGIWHHQ